MKILGKLRRDITNQRPGAISKKIIQAYRYMQGHWANWLARRTKGFSRRSWKMLLAVFVISVGLFCLCLTFNGFSGKRSHSFAISNIKTPKYVVGTEEAYLVNKIKPEIELEHLRRFRKYMDSMSLSHSGRIVVDSLLRCRPGLLDSVRLMENYFKQFKQK